MFGERRDSSTVHVQPPVLDSEHNRTTWVLQWFAGPDFLVENGFSLCNSKVAGDKVWKVGLR